MSNVNNLILLVLAFAIMTIVTFINHEVNSEINHLVPNWIVKMKQKKNQDNLDYTTVTQKPLTNKIQKTAFGIKIRDSDDAYDFKEGETEKKGTLVCNGKSIDSEIIFWKKVKNDRHFESPITPHHQ
jgi:hypothetical protein